MGFWDFTKKKDKIVSEPDFTVQNSNPPLDQEGPVLKKMGSPLPPEKLREHNIILLYQFLDDNYEVKGFNDSLVYPDTSFMNQNIESLKNELYRTIKKVKTYYQDFITETDFHIDSRSRSGMIETVEELKMKKKKAEDHLSKVLEIEKNAENNTGESQGIIFSYTRGFQNGLAAISHHSILNRKL